MDPQTKRHEKKFQGEGQTPVRYIRKCTDLNTDSGKKKISSKDRAKNNVRRILKNTVYVNEIGTVIGRDKIF